MNILIKLKNINFVSWGKKFLIHFLVFDLSEKFILSFFFTRKQQLGSLLNAKRERNVKNCSLYATTLLDFFSSSAPPPAQGFVRNYAISNFFLLALAQMVKYLMKIIFLLKTSPKPLQFIRGFFMQSRTFLLVFEEKLQICTILL